MGKFKKILFIGILPAIAVTGALGLYVSNMVRPLGNPDIPNVSIVALRINGLESRVDSAAVIKALSRLEGTTAAHVSLKDKLAAVTYNTDKLSSGQFLETVSACGNYTASFVTGPANYKEKCPVPSTWLTRVADIFRF